MRKSVEQDASRHREAQQQYASAASHSDIAVGGLGAALVFLSLAYAAYRGAFAHVQFNGGALGTAAVGRLLLAHDAFATEAIAVAVVIALVVLTLLWRARERDR